MTAVNRTNARRLADDPRLRTSAFAVSCLVGVALAAGGLLERDAAADADTEAVAFVGDRPITRDALERALAAVAADRRGGTVEPDDRDRVLTKLIDEELLVLRGLELDLARSNPRVRADLVRATLDVMVADGAAVEPTESQLRAFHADHSERFSAPPRLEVDHAWFGGPAAMARARGALDGRTLAGAGDPPPIPIPQGPCALSTITHAVGPTAASALLRAEVGDTIGPLARGGGAHVLRLVARHAGTTRPYEEVRDAVVDSYRRRAGEEAVRAHLARARQEHDVRIVGP